jgi:hypothetical protein
MAEADDFRRVEPANPLRDGIATTDSIAINVSTSMTSMRVKPVSDEKYFKRLVKFMSA